MPKTLRSPEKLFHAAMWAASVVFALFLIGLGGKIIADLRLTDSKPQIERFADTGRLAATRQAQAATQARIAAIEAELSTARSQMDQANNAHAAAKAGFDAWLSTRAATGLSDQDPEVIARTNEVVRLRSIEATARARVIDLQRLRNESQREIEHAVSQERQLLDAARDPYFSALRRHQMWVFVARLCFTLPLLVVSGWLIARKRQSRYWPLMRGFIIASAFAFFVELVPYLPSMGGYVRYLVGLAITLVAGHYGIRWMQDYLQRRQEEERRTEAERRATLDHEEALRKMRVQTLEGVCPGCERPMMTTDDVKPDFCCHCGLRLFDHCGQCKVRKNAYFNHCMGCGTPSRAAETPA